MKKKVAKAITKTLKGLGVVVDEATLEAVVGSVVAVFEKEHPTKTPVKYIWCVDGYSDGKFETGIWNKNEVKMVPIETAAKMFEHPDVYVAGDVAEATATIEKTEGTDPVEDEEKLADARNAINNFQEIDDIKRFIADNLHNQQIQIDGRSGIAKYREEAIRLIDTYGMP